MENLTGRLVGKRLPPPVMQRNRIFGTPPEPVFNMITSGLAPELLEEILYVLAEENEKNMDHINEHKGYFKGGRSAGRQYNI